MKAIPASEREDAAERFISRNRDALNESIRRSRNEVADGIHSRTIDDLIVDGRRRNKARS